MDLRERWEHYGEHVGLNYSVLPEDLKKRGRQIVFQPQSILVLRGDFPQYIYFIQSGSVLGQRTNSDGSEYKYFRVDSKDGNIGLLEVFGRKDRYVATIVCITEVVALEINSADFYDYVMQDVGLLRRCLSLVANDLYLRSGHDGRYYYMEGIDRVRCYFINYYTIHRDTHAQPVEVRMTYEDIAAEIGVSSRTVGRSIQRLRENGEIANDFRKIIITQEFYDILLGNLPA